MRAMEKECLRIDGLCSEGRAGELQTIQYREDNSNENPHAKRQTDFHELKKWVLGVYVDFHCFLRGGSPQTSEAMWCHCA